MGIYYITFWKLSWDENCTLAGYIRRKIANSLSFTTYFTSFEVMQTSISLPLLHQQQQGIRHNKSQSLKFCIQNVFWCFLMVNSRFWVPNNGHLPVSIQRFQRNLNVLKLRIKTYVNFVTNQYWTWICHSTPNVKIQSLINSEQQCVAVIVAISPVCFLENSRLCWFESCISKGSLYIS